MCRTMVTSVRHPLLMLALYLLLFCRPGVVDGDNTRRMGNLRDNMRRGVNGSNAGYKKGKRNSASDSTMRAGQQFEPVNLNSKKGTKPGVIKRKRRKLGRTGGGGGFLESVFPLRSSTGPQRFRSSELFSRSDSYSEDGFFLPGDGANRDSNDFQFSDDDHISGYSKSKGKGKGKGGEDYYRTGVRRSCRTYSKGKGDYFRWSTSSDDDCRKIKRGTFQGVFPPFASPPFPAPPPSADETIFPTFSLYPTESPKPTDVTTSRPTKAPTAETQTPTKSPTETTTQPTPSAPTSPMPSSTTVSPTQKETAMDMTAAPTTPTTEAPSKVGDTARPTTVTMAPSKGSPTMTPKDMPTVTPGSPTTTPKETPTVTPGSPTATPKDMPTVTPGSPTKAPEETPTVTPGSPTVTPKDTPTVTPGSPTKAPEDTPTVEPGSPTKAPEDTPTVEPGSPTKAPKDAPTVEPGSPTKAPEDTPTVTPGTPTVTPKDTPTVTPGSPTKAPEDTPTIEPGSPTKAPEDTPTVEPGSPTKAPEDTPTVEPGSPTKAPEDTPTAEPGSPTKAPKDTPTVEPGSPTKAPKEMPTVTPGNPTKSPKSMPPSPGSNLLDTVPPSSLSMDETESPTTINGTTGPTEGGTMEMTTETTVENADNITLRSPTTASTTSTIAPTVRSERSVNTGATLNFVLANTLGRTPIQQEIDGILEQVQIYYSDILTNAFPGFESFVTTETSTTSNVAGSFTLTMVGYTAVTTFTEGSTVPTQEEVDAVIQDADLTNFIQNYLPNATPSGSIFAVTEMVSSLSTTQG